jgi:hypothetical protein
LSYWASEGLQASQTSRRAGVLAHYTRCKSSVLDILSEIFFKNTSNILEYARIYSNILDISLLDGRGGLTGKAGGQVGAQTTL